jgi:hypothetical protein
VPPVTTAHVWSPPALIAVAPLVPVPDSDNTADAAAFTPVAVTDPCTVPDTDGANVTVNVHDFCGPKLVPVHRSFATVKLASPAMVNFNARDAVPPTFVNVNVFDGDCPTCTFPNEYGDDGENVNDGAPLFGVPAATAAVPVTPITTTAATQPTIDFTRAIARLIVMTPLDTRLVPAQPFQSCTQPVCKESTNACKSTANYDAPQQSSECAQIARAGAVMREPIGSQRASTFSRRRRVRIQKHQRDADQQQASKHGNPQLTARSTTFPLLRAKA